MSLVNNKMGPSLKVEHLQKLLKVTQVMNNVFNLTECESMYRTDSAQIRSAFSPWRNKLATIIYNSWFRLLQTSHVSLWLPCLSGSFEEIFCCNSRGKMLFIVNMYQSPLTSVSWYLYRMCDCSATSAPPKLYCQVEWPEHASVETCVMSITDLPNEAGTEYLTL